MKTTSLKFLKWDLKLKLPGFGRAIALAGILAAGSASATVVTTLGGGPNQTNTHYYGFVDGNTAQYSQFNFPTATALDPSGTLLFIADYTNNAVRMITLTGNAATSTTTTFAKNSDGINRPVSLLVDSQTNVYVLNYGNGTNGNILEYNALYATFNVPPIFLATNAYKLTNATAMAMDGLTNFYVTVRSNMVIKVAQSGAVSIVGIITNANTSLRGITILDNGQLALTDRGNHGIWIMNPLNGSLSNNAVKLTGFHGPGDTNGPPIFAAFNQPEGISKGGNNVLVVADRGNNKVKLVDAVSGTVSRLYGVRSNLWVQGTAQNGIYPGWWDGTVDPNENDVGSVEARQPFGVSVAQDGSVYTTEVYYDIIRKTTATNVTSPGGLVMPALFNSPRGIALDITSTHLYIADQANNSIDLLDLVGNSTIQFLTSANGINLPSDVAVDAFNSLFVLNQGTGGNGNILEFDSNGNFVGTNVVGLLSPTAMTIDSGGNFYVAELNGVIQQFSGATSNTIVTITNAGVQLQGIAIFDDGTIAVSDSGNQVIWQVNPVTKAVSVLTGTIGVPGSALGSLNQPQHLTKAAGNQIVIADAGNNRLDVMSRSGSVTNVLKSTNSIVWFGRAGDPYAAGSSRWVPMVSPSGVAIGSAGEVYASETADNDIRKIFSTGLAQSPLFNSPRGIALDLTGTYLYIADQANNAIDLLDLVGNSTIQFLTSANGINLPSDVAVDAFNSLFVLNQGTGGNGNILEFDSYGNLVGTNVAGLYSPTAMAIDFDGNFYVAELNGVVQKFSGATSNTIVTITNAGVQLQGIAVFDDGTVAVSDSGNHVIWQVNPVTKAVSVLTGKIGVPGSTLGSAAFAKLNQPRHLVRAAGNQILIADAGNNRLAVVTRSGSVTNILKSTNSIVWFGRAGDPYATNSLKWVPMVSPSGVVIGNAGEVYDSETVYNDIRKVLNTGLAQPPAPSPAPTPKIGWIDFQPPIQPVSVLVTALNNQFILNNDVAVAILGTGDDQVYYTYGPTASASLIPEPNATNGATAPFYQNGMLPGTTPSSIVPIAPDVTIKAIGFNSSSPYSAVVQARFEFETANPQISGNNAALFSVTNVTSGTQFYYTIDGSDPDPTTNALSSIGPISSGVLLSLDGSGDFTFKVRGFKANYQPSAVISTVFASSNFIPNKISFGVTNANVELHSTFITRPGQFFYAPVTLQLQPGGDTMYSLQFNVSVTNSTGTTHQIQNGSGIDFFSMLQTQVNPEEGDHYPPNSGQWYLDILPFLLKTTTNVNAHPLTTFVNTNNNLLGIGWLYRQGFRYQITDPFNKMLTDFDTKKQDLISFSIAHDTLFQKGDGTVIVGAFSFQVPSNAVVGDAYYMQLGSPSATRDGIGAPGSSVYIRSPGNNQRVDVGAPIYLVGDAAPFRWLNAGDFGEGKLLNDDVMQVFQAAVLLVDVPPTNSDLYLAMDSCGDLGSFDFNNNYYTNAGPMSPGQINAILDGGDKTIDQVAFGDGQLDINDVYVTLRRSLDSSLLWYERYWTNGQFVAITTTNLAFNSNSPVSLPPMKLDLGQSDSGDFADSFISFGAGDVIASGGQTVQIPVTANVFGGYALRVLGLNITVEPLDGSPAVTNDANAVQFTPSPGMGQPTFIGSKNPANYSAAWLDASIAGLRGNSVIGTLTVTIPSTAGTNSAYAIHFDHASASPDGVALFPSQKTSGLITLSSRTNSTWNDGIPDSWRLRYFGSVNNALSQATADADGDGMNNLHEYIAGTDPLDPNSNLRIGNYSGTSSGFSLTSLGSGADSAASDCVIHWPSVLGKTYVVERASSLYSPVWTAVSTNIGTGTDMQIDDTDGGNTRFYRVRVQ